MRRQSYATLAEVSVTLGAKGKTDKRRRCTNVLTTVSAKLAAEFPLVFVRQTSDKTIASI